MPFTFSHPAIVLPFLKKVSTKLSFTGLVVGSMVPDFEYFIRMEIKSECSHSYLAGLGFNLPMALLICLIFHQLIKPSLIPQLPLFLRKRMVDLYRADWFKYFKSNWLIVLYSIILGTLSHIFWDSFTHKGAYFVEILELNSTFTLFGRWPYYKILQHLSTVLGALYIIHFISTLPEKDITVYPKKSRFYWLYVTFIVLFVLCIRFNNGIDIKAFGNIIVSTIAAFILAITLIGLFQKNE